LASRFASKELLTFRQRARYTGQNLVLPVILRGSDIPIFLTEIQYFDLRKISSVTTSKSRWPAALKREIIRLAEALNLMIDSAPSYDPHWADFSPSDTEADQSSLPT
jgi:hypothetical protein